MKQQLRFYCSLSVSQTTVWELFDQILNRLFSDHYQAIINYLLQQPHCHHNKHLSTAIPSHFLHCHESHVHLGATGNTRLSVKLQNHLSEFQRSPKQQQIENYHF